MSNTTEKWRGIRTYSLSLDLAMSYMTWKNFSEGEEMKADLQYVDTIKGVKKMRHPF